jgi:hypothetical protein
MQDFARQTGAFVADEDGERQRPGSASGSGVPLCDEVASMRTPFCAEADQFGRKSEEKAGEKSSLPSRAEPWSCKG